MRSAKLDSRGFTLIASLLLMLLLSGIAISLLMMVRTEQQSGNADRSNNYTYRSAEGGMEKMTSDLANVFKSIQSPTNTEICNSAAAPTWDPSVSYPVYTVAPIPGATTANPCPPLPNPPPWGPINTGPDAGLYAQILPVTLNVQALRADNQESVSMTRTAEVVLIPVFQFGVFCDGDCFFGQSPNLGFAGRVHTNGDLYLGVANGYNLVFGDKLSAFGNVIRQQMDNGLVVGGGLDDGTVLVPNTSNGCAAQMANVAGATASSTCINLASAFGSTVGSVTGGHGSAQNTTNWKSVSTGTLASYLIDGNGPSPVGSTNPGTNNTGASDLTLPFVQGTTFAYEIIRRPPPGESPSSLLGGSRLANEAQIRVLLSDKEADLHLPGWNGDATQDVELASLAPEFASTAFSQTGIVINGNTYYFGESACGAGSVGSQCTSGKGDTNFVWPPWVPGGTVATHYATQAEWPIVNGWLLVEVKWASDGLWHPATKEWLSLGFARGLHPPTAPGTNNFVYYPSGTGNPAVTNTDQRNAILYLQQQADRQGNNYIDTTDQLSFTSVTAGAITTPVAPYGTNSQYNWYPINLYDAREGEVYDGTTTSTFPYNAPGNGSINVNATGTPNGIMNAVELDVGNLKKWLAGLTGTPTGQNVDYVTQNGYILYFSDRRGMQYNAAVSTTNLIGEYGFEDTVNYVNIGNKLVPDGRLDPNNYNSVSPEDVNGNGTLDNYGVKTVGDAFGTQTTTDTDVTNPPNPYAHRVLTFTIGRANRVTGARHALKLVDGSLGNVPTMPVGNANNNCAQTAANPTACGGFTVGSENPVYILGNYNSNCPAAVGSTPNPCTPGNVTYDTAWSGGAEPPHAAASVIADAVTLLSNNWQDGGCTPVTAWCTATMELTSGSLLNPANPYRSGSGSSENNPGWQPNRLAVTSYYRVAIAGGKTIAFNDTTGNPDEFFGSDGGIHNFLRQLEDWGGPVAGTTQQQLWYKGSLVSLYWNTYATGTFKCCNLVYTPPSRQYTFDPLFALPQNLPPGTPMFRNVDNLSYRQNQFARSN
jgi:hypothetical protein